MCGPLGIVGFAWSSFAVWASDLPRMCGKMGDRAPVAPACSCCGMGCGKVFLLLSLGMLCPCSSLRSTLQGGILTIEAWL